MDRTPVESSNVVSVGYEGGILTIEFKSGFVYAYEHVGPDVYHAFMGSESKGQFFSKFIRGQYEYKKLQPGTNL